MQYKSPATFDTMLNIYKVMPVVYSFVKLNMILQHGHSEYYPVPAY